jgi:eukaryotic-like serine/threonine-protein kinase
VPMDRRQENGVFLAMEFVEGFNLAQWSEAQPHTWRQVLDTMLAAGRGLSYAHARGFVHRDFKPTNVLVGKDGRVRVADFGLARVTRELTAPVPGMSVRIPGETSVHALHLSLTKPGTVIGTPAYMAPEQHLSSRADARSDQFSFCLTLFELMHGQSPFQGPTPGKILEAKLRGVVGPPPRDSKVPASIHRAIVKGLAPDPMDRHASMDTLLEALASPHDDRRLLAIVVASVATLAAAGGAAAVMAPTFFPDACADMPERAAAWNDAAADRTHAAATALSLGFGETTFVHLRRELDRWASSWTVVRNEACAGSADELAARRACLDLAERRVAALVEAMARPSPAMLERAIAAASALPDPQRCLAPAPARAADAGSLERPEVGALRSEVARAETLALLGQRDEAESAATAAAEHARQVTDPWSELHASALVAELTALRDPGAGGPLLVDALLRADAHGDDELGHGLAIAALAAAVDRGDRDTIAGARERLESGRPSAPVRARVLVELARDAASRDRSDEATTLCKTALASAQELDPPPPTVLAALGWCAEHALDGGAVEDALALGEWLVTATDRVFGSDHPGAALARERYGRALIGAARPEEARGHLQSALVLLEHGTSTYDLRRLAPLVALAELDRQRGPVAADRWKAQITAISSTDTGHRVATLRATFDLTRAMYSYDRIRARALAQSTLTETEIVGPQAQPLAASIRAWLGGHSS